MSTNYPFSDSDVNLADWHSIREWRKAQRELLIRSRIKIGMNTRKFKCQKLQDDLQLVLSSFEPGVIGFYWPIKGEFDLRNLVEKYLTKGWSAALPVVNAKNAPMEFRTWTPSSKLIPGIWNIPIPADKCVVEPSVLLVPLVGFDDKLYRLDYGGGYYDQTIAHFRNRPYSIGIGLEISRLDTIYPQSHDIPMDKLITV